MQAQARKQKQREDEHSTHELFSSVSNEEIKPKLDKLGRQKSKVKYISSLGTYNIKDVVIVDGEIDEKGHIRLYHHDARGETSKVYTFGLGRIRGQIRRGEPQTVRLLLFRPARPSLWRSWTPVNWKHAGHNVHNALVEIKVVGRSETESGQEHPYLVIVPWEERNVPHHRACRREAVGEPIYKAKRVEKIATAYKRSGTGYHATRVDVLLVWGDKLEMEREYEAFYPARGWSNKCAGKYAKPGSAFARWTVRRVIELK